MRGIEHEPTVLFRCDGTATTGIGHVGRSLALAEALVEQGYRPLFVGRYDAPIAARLDQAGIEHCPIEGESWS